MRAGLPVRVAGTALLGLACGSCDFSRCAWCSDAGYSCSATNQWNAPGIQAGLWTMCIQLDGGEDDAGELGYANCKRQPDAGGGMFDVFSQPFNVSAGDRICARVVVSDAPTSGVTLNIVCEVCQKPDICTCFDEADAGCVAQLRPSGPVISGPFLIPSTCMSVHAGLYGGPIGGIAFSQGWSWITDGGCTWDDVAQCPGP